MFSTVDSELQEQKINILAIKLADDAAAAAAAELLVAGFVRPSTLSILLFNSSTVFVTEVTISMGVPFFPIKNNDGNGTSLSTNHKYFN